MTTDFSPAIHRRRKKEQYYPPPSKAMEATRYELGYGFRATSGEDEAERGEEGFQEVKKTTKESTLDRLRRLRIEMDEVESELQESATGSKSESVGPDQGQAHKKDGENERASLSLLVQLKSLRGQLGQLDQRASQAADVGLDAAASQRWEREARKLLESLSSIERREDLTKSSHANVDDGDSQPIKLDSEGVKMASLDRRLAGLEDLVGIRDAAQDDVSLRLPSKLTAFLDHMLIALCLLIQAKSLVRPLLPSVARIEHLLTLLTHPRHLDGISRRVKVLVSELERVHEARRKIDTSSASNRLGIPSANGLEGGSSPLLGGTSPGVGTSSPNGLTTETLTKLEANFALLSRLEPLMPLAPTLLSRLHSLSSLHASAAGFSDDVNSLLVAAKTSEATHEELQTVLTNVESSLRENQQRVQANLESVEARIEGLAKRVEKLS